MGNADLRSLAEIHEDRTDKLTGSTVAVDAPNWLYKYLTTTVQWNDDEVYTTDNGERVPNLLGVIQGIPRFFEHDIKPVFVFDGGYHDEKRGEVEERKAKKKVAEEKAEKAKKDGDVVRAAKLDARTQRLTDTVIQTTKELFDILDIAYMEAPKAAEAQTAYMSMNGDIDYVISEDYDSLLFGALKTVRDFTSSADGIEVMDFDKTLENLEITHEQLVDIAILCGTDYNDGVHGVGTVTAVEGVKEHGSIEEILEKNDVQIENLDDIREIFLRPAVTDNYAVPHDYPSPNIEEAKRFVVDEWEIPESKISKALQRIDDSTSQTGLGEWT